MNGRRLREALRRIDVVRTDPRFEADQRDQLAKLKRRLQKLERCGKLKRHDVFLTIDGITTLLYDAVRRRS